MVNKQHCVRIGFQFRTIFFCKYSIILFLVIKPFAKFY